MEVSDGVWTFDEDDWCLIAQLQDPVYCAELLFTDPNNREYSGCYKVLDYQYPLFRHQANDEGRPCARSVGKTEGCKADAVSHVFRRLGEDMLITAPEQIHLDPLTDAIEMRIVDTRLTNEFLDTRSGKTGITHRPFEATFLDGTRIVGRIPKLTGTGVKGQHVSDLRVEEAQDYPERGWIEVDPTVKKDHVDPFGHSDYSFIFFGVHSGVRDGKFYELSTSGAFKITQVTALMRPTWNAQEKAKATAMYGGTHVPDYRRNILGEAGGAASAFFVTARLMACIDQDRESDYNTRTYVRQKFVAEEVDRLLPSGVAGRERDEAMYETLGTLINMPVLQGSCHLGIDIGLVNDPTVVTLWEVATVKKRSRMRLVRMWHLWRFREKMLRQIVYQVAWQCGRKLQSAGWDITGLGLPVFQAMDNDERDQCPQHLVDVSRGYTFNAKVPIAVDKNYVTKDASGQLRDHMGSIVREEPHPTRFNEKRYVTYMSMIEASTRYLREWVDAEYLQLPFDPEVAGDFQAETVQRVQAVAGQRRKPGGLHILDSARVFAMATEAEEVEQEMRGEEREPVLARAVVMPSM